MYTTGQQLRTIAKSKKVRKRAFTSHPAPLAEPVVYHCRSVNTEYPVLYALFPLLRFLNARNDLKSPSGLMNTIGYR
jgi:hypothetical protein